MLNSKLTILLLAILCFPITAEAVCRVYVIPIVGTGTFQDPKRPDFTGSLNNRTVHYWGKQGFALVVSDTTTGENNTLSGQVGVVKIPDNLDTAIGAQLATVQNVFESRHIPGNWIQSTDTYRQVLRVAVHMFQIFQRFYGISGLTVPVIGQGGITLNTTYGSLLQLRQDQLLEAIQSFFPNVKSITADTTLRQLFKQGADLFEDRPFSIGCLTI